MKRKKGVKSALDSFRIKTVEGAIFLTVFCFLDAEG